MIRAMVYATVAALMLLAYANGEAGAQEACDKTVGAGNSVAAAVANAAPGATVCVADGHHPSGGEVAVLKSGQTVRALDTDAAWPTVDGQGAPKVFDVSGVTGASVRGLEIVGSGGNDSCEPGCGKAIGMADARDVPVVGNWIHDHPNQGIAAQQGSTFSIRNNLIEDTGSFGFTLLDECAPGQDNCKKGHGPSSTAALKFTTGAGGVLSGNTIRDNYWTGSWCDDGGGSIEAEGNLYLYNGKTGAQHEKCTAPSAYRQNVYRGNGRSEADITTNRGGMTIRGSKNVTVRGGTAEANRGHGIDVAPQNGYPVANVRIIDLNLVRDTKAGCDLAGVTCRGVR